MQVQATSYLPNILFKGTPVFILFNRQSYQLIRSIEQKIVDFKKMISQTPIIDTKTHWTLNFRQIFTSSNRYHFFKWSNDQQEWTPLQTDFDPSQYENFQDLQNFNKKTNKIDKQLLSVTLNVLFDYRNQVQPDKDRGHMKYSLQRYESILDQLQKMDCDVITLNEVTKHFVKMIEKTQWVREKYQISTVHNQKTSINCFGNIIMTKLNPLALHVYKVPGLPRAVPIGFFLIENNQQDSQFTLKKPNYKKRSIVTFSSIHLTAYDKNYDRRQKQLTALKLYLNRYNKCVDQHILQGDLNFHSQTENLVAQGIELLDSWIKVNQIKNQKDFEENPGFTFDSEKNFLIRELYWGFQKRKMRLDRIFYSKHSFNPLTPFEMKVIFNEPIYKEIAEQPSSNIFKSTLSFLADKAKLNVFRNKEKYLFCSDHFGLTCRFKLNL